MKPLDATTVQQLAAQQQQDWVDEETARRIAAGAAAAVTAVSAVLAQSGAGPLTRDAADFAAVLESLAGDAP